MAPNSVLIEIGIHEFKQQFIFTCRRENAGRLTEKNYELLKILIHLLESSKDPLVLSVACYDVGEFVRHYPRGKTCVTY